MKKTYNPQLFHWKQVEAKFLTGTEDYTPLPSRPNVSVRWDGAEVVVRLNESESRIAVKDATHARNVVKKLDTDDGYFEWAASGVYAQLWAAVQDKGRAAELPNRPKVYAHYDGKTLEFCGNEKPDPDTITHWEKTLPVRSEYHARCLVTKIDHNDAYFQWLRKSATEETLPVC